jgi:hypothetical protein
MVTATIPRGNEVKGGKWTIGAVALAQTINAAGRTNRKVAL